MEDSSDAPSATKLDQPKKRSNQKHQDLFSSGADDETKSEDTPSKSKKRIN